MKITRRTFLKLSGAGLLAAGAAYAGCSFRSDRRQVPDHVDVDRVRNVIVVGAGLSGLVAAYLLSESGKRVTVLEANDHPGGRVHTHRWPNGQISEAGFEEFSSHDIDPDVWWLVQELGLGPQIRTYPGSIGAFLRGEYVPPTTWESWIRSLPWQNPLADAAEYEEMSEDISNRIGYLWKPGREEDYLKYDHQTMSEWILENYDNSGRGEVEWLTNIFLKPSWGVPLDQLSAATGIASYWYWYNVDSAFHLEDGNDQLIQGLVDRLPAESLKLSSTVSSIRHTGNGEQAEVEYHSEGTGHSVSADLVVVAVPHTLVPKIVPDLSQDRIESLSRLQHSKVIRTDYQFSEKTWQTDFGFNGSGIYTDQTVAWVSNRTRDYDTGVLAGYVNEPEASQNWVDMDSEFTARVFLSESAGKPIADKVLGELEQVWPGLERSLLETRIAQVPYYGPVQPPGYVSNGFYDLNQEPFGRIFFAGDWVYGFGASDAISRGRDVASFLLGSEDDLTTALPRSSPELRRYIPAGSHSLHRPGKYHVKEAL